MAHSKEIASSYIYVHFTHVPRVSATGSGKELGNARKRYNLMERRTHKIWKEDDGIWR